MSYRFEPLGADSESGVAGYSDGIHGREPDVESWKTQEQAEDYSNGYADGTADSVEISLKASE